jgi:hypothetical protein
MIHGSADVGSDQDVRPMVSKVSKEIGHAKYILIRQLVCNIVRLDEQTCGPVVCYAWDSSLVRPDLCKVTEECKGIDDRT